MTKKLLLLFCSLIVAMSALCITARAQELPSGPINNLLNCSLNDGVTMAEVVEWARLQPRDDNAPNAIFFRQALFTGVLRNNSDFTIANFYPSYAEMIRRVEARSARSRIRERTFRRGADLFTCDPSTSRIVHNRFVNPGDNDGFSGDMTLMQTRFCRLRDGQTVADAWEFAQGIARNYAAAGDKSLFQMWTRELSPVGDTVAGGAVVLSAVPATPDAFGMRLDLRRNGVDPLEGLRPIPVTCDAPAMWATHAIHRGGIN